MHLPYTHFTTVTEQLAQIQDWQTGVAAMPTATLYRRTWCASN
jgi:hypothetical protein